MKDNAIFGDLPVSGHSKPLDSAFVDSGCVRKPSGIVFIWIYLQNARKESEGLFIGNRKSVQR